MLGRGEMILELKMVPAEQNRLNERHSQCDVL